MSEEYFDDQGYDDYFSDEYYSDDYSYEEIEPQPVVVPKNDGKKKKKKRKKKSPSSSSSTMHEKQPKEDPELEDGWEHVGGYNMSKKEIKEKKKADIQDVSNRGSFIQAHNAFDILEDNDDDIFDLERMKKESKKRKKKARKEQIQNRETKKIMAEKKASERRKYLSSKNFTVTQKLKFKEKKESEMSQSLRDLKRRKEKEAYRAEKKRKREQKAKVNDLVHFFDSKKHKLCGTTLPLNERISKFDGLIDNAIKSTDSLNVLAMEINLYFTQNQIIYKPSLQPNGEINPSEPLSLIPLSTAHKIKSFMKSKSEKKKKQTIKSICAVLFSNDGLFNIPKGNIGYKLILQLFAKLYPSSFADVAGRLRWKLSSKGSARTNHFLWLYDQFEPHVALAAWVRIFVRDHRELFYASFAKRRLEVALSSFKSLQSVDKLPFTVSDYTFLMKELTQSIDTPRPIMKEVTQGSIDTLGLLKQVGPYHHLFVILTNYLCSSESTNMSKKVMKQFVRPLFELLSGKWVKHDHDASHFMTMALCQIALRDFEWFISYWSSLMMDQYFRGSLQIAAHFQSLSQSGQLTKKQHVLFHKKILVMLQERVSDDSDLRPQFSNVFEASCPESSSNTIFKLFFILMVGMCVFLGVFYKEDIMETLASMNTK
mmetsp:Transcript_11222/g.16593  ORF Transcript_11222/g.16593 Transcript_11222/m.16593 type:complete len:654 (-) Transcript_11222:916-2877(-)